MRRSPACLLAGLLSGCAVGPAYVAPTVTVPAQFMGSAAVQPAAADGSSVDLVSWWTSFDDPLIGQFVERALAQNLDLQQAAARVTQARAALRGANSALLPSAGINASAGTLYQSLETPQGRMASAQPGFDREGQAFDAGIGASWEVDLFGGRNAARDAAVADWQASAAAAAAARVSIAAQTAETYVAIRGIQARLAVARERLGVQRELVRLVALRHRGGLAAEFEVRQAEGAVAQVAASVPELEEQRDRAMNALDVLLGLPPGGTRADLAEVKGIPAPPVVASAGGPAAMIRRRPDVIAAERRLAASNARIAGALAEYYPKFTLSGLLGSATTNAGSLLGGDSIQASGILGLRWRLFDFGRIDAEVAAARGGNAEALAAYRQTILRACEDVENDWLALVKQREREVLLTQGEASLAAARQTAFTAYKGGIASLLDVLEADRRLLDVRDANIQTRAATARAAISTFRALGGGWNAAA